MENKKPKKRKYLYYICTQESVMTESTSNHIKIDTDTLVDVSPEDVEKYTFAYVTQVPDAERNVGFSMWIYNRSILKYKKLSYLLDDFIFSFDYNNGVPSNSKEDDINDKVADRLDLLCEEYFVMKVDVKASTMTYVEPEVIRNCYKSIINAPEEPFRYEDFTSPDSNSIGVDIMDIFKEQLDKCFGKNKRGIITFVSDNYFCRWDVIKDKKEYSFGVDENQNKLFNKRIADLFVNGSSCSLRIFTDDVINKVPVKELYAFVLSHDFSITNINYLEVKDLCLTNKRTGEKLSPEKNVVYCDIDGNRLCSADIN